MTSTIRLERDVPVVDAANVVVAGGGIAGCCAACAAAGEGASTVLVERFATLGGVGTTGGVSGFCGETSGQGAVFDEILAGLRECGGLHPVRKHLYDHQLLAVVLQRVVQRHGVKVLLHARVADAIVHDQTITHVIISGSSGLQAIAGARFIDCTGEADLARAAGCRCQKGRPGDGYQLPMSLNFFVRTRLRGRETPTWTFSSPPYTSRGELPMVTVKRTVNGDLGVKVKLPMHDATDTARLSAAEMAGRERMMQLLQYFQARRHKRWSLVYCSPVIGIREGARVLGEYTLVVDDVRAGATFPDVAAVGTYQLDAHTVDDDRRAYEVPREQLHVPPYQIPARCLLAADVTNLGMAGRCMSADQLALSSARVMTTCAQTGQAIGTIAAMSVARGLPLKQHAADGVADWQAVLVAGGTLLDLGAY